MGISPTIVAYHGRFEAGGRVRTSHQSPIARLGAANVNPINLSSGCRGESLSNLLLRRSWSYMRGKIPKNIPTRIARKRRDDCCRDSPKSWYITGRACVKRYIRAHPTALMIETTNTIGSVKKRWMGRRRAILAKVPKLGVWSGLLMRRCVRPVSLWSVARRRETSTCSAFFDE